MDATQKFSGKAAAYNRYRPDYPDACIDFIMEQAGLSLDAFVADIGAGTGIFSRRLRAHGLRVYAVEPNADMRTQAQAAAHGDPGLIHVDGSAEKTCLEDASVSLVTAAQAFHWFDPTAFGRECNRILKLDGSVALIWNHRDAAAPLVQENAHICERYCPDFPGFSSPVREKHAQIARFFAGKRYAFAQFDNPLSLDRDSFIGRNLSSSYAPLPTQAHFRPFVDALAALFDRYSEGGRVQMPYYTCVYVGRPA